MKKYQNSIHQALWQHSLLFFILCLELLIGCRSFTKDSNQALDGSSSLAESQSRNQSLFDKILAQVRAGNPAKGTVPSSKIVSYGNSVNKTPLIRGKMIFDAFVKRIVEARREVLLETFLWEPGSQSSQKIIDAFSALCKKPRESQVDIRILISNAMGKAKSEIESLRESLYTKESSPCYQKPGIRILVGAYNTYGLDGFHVKNLIVDNEWFIITGANIQKSHDDNLYPWYDLGFEFWGPVADSARASFSDSWRNAVLSTTDLNSWPKNAGVPLLLPPAPEFDPMRRPKEAQYSSGIRLALLSQRGVALPSKSEDSPQDLGFSAAFENAQKHIHIQTPNFNADGAFYGVIGSVGRGITVQLIVSKGFNFITESIPTINLGKIEIFGQKGSNFTNVRDLYDELLKKSPSPSGAETSIGSLNFRAYWYSLEAGHPAKSSPSIPVFAIGDDKPYSSHAKYLTADDQIAIVGSGNMDTQSWHQSRELNVLVDSPEVVASWENTIFLKNLEQAVPVCPAHLTKARDCRMDVPDAQTGRNW